MTKYVLSTATCSHKFHDFAKAERGAPNVSLRSVLVRGGANSPSIKSGFGDQTQTEEGIPLWTPAGVVTPVSDEDAELLARNETFKRGVSAGFFKILDTNPGDSHKAVKKQAADMETRDKSAPLTPETLSSRVKVTTAKVEQ